MGSQSLCYVNGFHGSNQFNKTLVLNPVSSEWEGIPGEKGDVIGCESRIPFKVKGSKWVVILYAVNSVGQAVDRREIVKNSRLWEYVCEVMGLSRTWSKDEIGFMDKPLKLVSFCDVLCDDVIDNVYDERDASNELRHGDCSSCTECSVVEENFGNNAVFSDDEDIVEMESRYADLLDGTDRVPGVDYVGGVSEVIPGHYRFVEASRHRQPIDFMKVGDAEASAILSDKTCLQPEELFRDIDGDMDNDERNVNIFDELVSEEPEEPLSELESVL